MGKLFLRYLKIRGENMLLITNKPYENEVLSSFVYRHAKNNLMDNLNWIIDIINLDLERPIKEYTIDWADNIAIGRLSNLLRIKEDEILKMTFNYHKNRLDLETNNIYKSPWFIYRTVRCCPLCLKEAQYVKTDWCLSQSICCHRHKKYLIDRCTCTRELTPKVILSGICLCGQEIYSLNSKDVLSKEVTEFQEFLNRFLYNNTPIRYNSWIHKSTIFFKCIELFASWAPLIINKKTIPNIDGFEFDGSSHARTRLKKSRSISQSVVIYCLAHKILQNWPNSFHKILKYADHYNAEKLEMFFRRTILSLVNSPLHTISSEFTKFLQIYKLKMDSNLLLLRSDEAKSLTMRYKETAIKEDTLDSYQCYINKLKVTLYSDNQLKDWLNIIKSLITKEEVREAWKTSAKATFNILNNNVLKNLYLFQQGSVIAWGIPKQSILDLNERLKAKSIDDIQDKISLNKLFYWIGPAQAHYILKGMINSNIRCTFNEKHLGLSFVSKSECYYFIEKILLDVAKKEGKISIRDLVFVLGVKKSDIVYWIKTNRLELTLNLEFITYNSFNSFYQKYMTTYQLAFLKGLSVKQILKLNQIKKINAVSGPHNNDGQRLLFLRNNFISTAVK